MSHQVPYGGPYGYGGAQTTDQYGNEYYAPQPDHGTAPAGGTYPVVGSWDQQSQDAQRDASVALVLGIVGLFTLQIILGPMAIYFATRARRQGNQAKPGLVLGWVALALGVLATTPILLFLLVALWV